MGDNQRVHVALNHQLVSALLAPGYAQVLLSERLRLGSQTSILVHAFLSTCLGRGKTMSIGYEKLVERLWPSKGSAVPASTHRRRLSDVRSALQAVGRLDDWKVELNTAVASVTRTVTRSTALGKAESAQAKALTCAKAPPGPSAREMTKPRLFGVADASYAERPFWPKSSPDKQLP